MAGSAWSNQPIATSLVIIEAGGGFTGLFMYSGPPAAGNLIASETAQAGTDPFGNAYMAGDTSYFALVGGLILAVSNQQGGIQYAYANSFAGPFITFNTSEPLIFAADVALGIPQTQYVQNTGNWQSGGIVFLQPSGDTTGATDTAMMVEVLSQGLVAWLGAGQFFVTPAAPGASSGLIINTGYQIYGSGRSNTKVTLTAPFPWGTSTGGQVNETKMAYLHLDGVTHGVDIFSDANFGRFDLIECQLDIDASHHFWNLQGSTPTGNFIMHRSQKNTYHYKGPRSAGDSPFMIIMKPGTQVTQSTWENDDWFNDDNDTNAVIMTMNDTNTNGSTNAVSRIVDLVTEHAYAGIFHGESLTGWRFENVVAWDLPATSIVGDMFFFGKDHTGANPSPTKDVSVIGYSRRGGSFTGSPTPADINIEGTCQQITLDTCGSDVGGSLLQVNIGTGATGIGLYNLPQNYTIGTASGANWSDMNTRGYQNGWVNAATFTNGRYRLADNNEVELIGSLTAPAGVVANQVIINLPNPLHTVMDTPVPCILPAGAYLHMTATTGNLCVGGGIAAGNNVVFACRIPLDA